MGGKNSVYVCVCVMKNYLMKKLFKLKKMQNYKQKTTTKNLIIYYYTFKVKLKNKFN